MIVEVMMMMKYGILFSSSSGRKEECNRRKRGFKFSNGLWNWASNLSKSESRLVMAFSRISGVSISSS